MKKSILNARFFLIVGLILTGAFFRLLPHWPNFTPIAAIALFGGTYLKRKELAFIIPIATMLLSDAIIGFHNVMIPVYASMMLIVGLGFFLRNRLSVMSVVSFSILSSVIFFLITNLASWATGMMPYSPGLPGILQAYIAGLPFFLNGLIGDLFYSSVLFGSFYLLTQRSSIFAE